MTFGLLADSIKYLTTPVPYHLRAMGYVRELKALGTRRNRCRAAWQPHLDNTRAVILAAADRCENTDKALILGSGLLFDIPIAELSRRFGEVVLVDIVHLWRVHRHVRQYSNVFLVQQDITGIIEQIYRMARTRKPVKMPRHKPEFFLKDDFDLVVSANIVSQLPVLPNSYISRRLGPSIEDQLTEFSRRLVTNHLDWLCAFQKVICLIADLERLQYRGSKLIHREASLWGINLPKGGRKWRWELAPRPEMDFQLDIYHQVIGYTHFPKHAWLTRNCKNT